MRRDLLVGWFAMALWLYALWILLSWTATTEQLVYGAVFAVVLAVPLSRIGEVGRPWRLLYPRRWPAAVKLAATYARRLVTANVSLSRRIWSPSRPLRSGMVVFPDPTSSDGALTALGIITSTVVDNQLVDVHRADVDGTDEPAQLQYHGVSIESEDPADNREQVAGSMPGLLDRLTGRR